MLNKHKRLLLNCLIAATLAFITLPANAINISKTQDDAYQAHETHYKNIQKVESLEARITQQEKRMADEQAKLDTLKAQQAAAQKALVESKKDLDAKVKRLNELWSQRDK